MTAFPKRINQYFDHAALKSETSEKEIIILCDEARQYDLFAVAINPVWVATALKELDGSEVQIVTVCGFPLGASRTEIKIAEAVQGVSDGAHEIDMVANIGWLVEGRLSKVEKEIAEIRNSLPESVTLKVIIEACKLDEQQQEDATRTVVNGGAQFVKTSTGFFGGATAAMVATMHRAAAGQVQVKASGGIRTLEQCRELLAAGATRLGSSSSATIMEEFYRLAEGDK